eukprot:181819-Karenia_brevis.AAC.1
MWIQLKGFVRFPKDKAKNIIDSRWVLKCKLVDGFKDAQAQDIETFAGTASRWGQRIVNAAAAQ